MYVSYSAETLIWLNILRFLTIDSEEEKFLIGIIQYLLLQNYILSYVYLHCTDKCRRPRQTCILWLNQ